LVAVEVTEVPDAPWFVLRDSAGTGVPVAAGVWVTVGVGVAVAVAAGIGVAVAACVGVGEACAEAVSTIPNSPSRTSNVTAIVECVLLIPPVRVFPGQQS
jgi:hypothetical protein